MGGLGGTPPIRTKKKDLQLFQFFMLFLEFIFYLFPVSGNTLKKKKKKKKKKKAILCLSEPTLKIRPYCIMKQQNSQNLDI